MLMSFSGREGWVKGRLDHSFAVVLQTIFQKSWDTVQIVNKKGMQ